MKRQSVIKAPACFGKTSLTVAWTDRLMQSGSSLAWLSIDPSDNQPTHFLF
jgi:LuxR family transcriptional regulator, maltose regulon positive regulatory protein